MTEKWVISTFHYIEKMTSMYSIIKYIETNMYFMFEYA